MSQRRAASACDGAPHVAPNGAFAMLRPLFALAFLAFAMFGPIAAVASVVHPVADAAAASDDIPDRIAQLFAKAW